MNIHIRHAVAANLDIDLAHATPEQIDKVDICAARSEAAMVRKLLHAPAFRPVPG